MSLLGLIRKGVLADVATATPTTSATDTTGNPSTVAVVAKVADIAAMTSAELGALVNAVCSFHGLTDGQRGEAHAIARGDQEAALECFRVLADAIPKPPADDLRRCTQCKELGWGNQCQSARRGEMGLPLVYRPSHDPRRCKYFQPKPDDPDQRPGYERWPGLDRKFDD